MKWRKRRKRKMISPRRPSRTTNVVPLGSAPAQEFQLPDPAVVNQERPQSAASNAGSFIVRLQQPQPQQQQQHQQHQQQQQQQQQQPLHSRNRWGPLPPVPQQRDISNAQLNLHHVQAGQPRPVGEPLDLRSNQSYGYMEMSSGLPVMPAADGRMSINVSSSGYDYIVPVPQGELSPEGSHLYEN